MVVHIVNGLYIICLSGGITLIIFSFFAAKRLSSPNFRRFAFLFIAATLMLVVEAARTYQKALDIDSGKASTILFAACSFAANALLSWFLLRIVHGIFRVQPAARRTITYVAVSLFLGVLGALKEIVFTFILWNVDYVALLGLHLYCAVLLYRGLAAIEPPLLRSLIRSFLIYLAVFAPIAVAQLVLQDIPSSPSFIHDWPLEQLLYYLGFVIIALLYMSRFFLGPTADDPIHLEGGTLERFGISKREADIISMMIKGYTNRSIGEKLFISASTVKNHVYHIYRKTGVDNKIQLLNLIKPPK
jgi:DNA-binding CsgD family transcriptional regulator